MKPSKYSLALVTGASSGIGKALCTLLAQQGIALLISGRNESNLIDLASELSSTTKVDIVAADLSDPVQRQQLISKMKEAKPDLVINNAGFGLYGVALNHEIKDQIEILEVDGKAVLEITLEAARMLLESNKEGVILNVSSAAGYQEIFPGFAVYAATKAFVTQVSESLNYELNPRGIYVLASCPGMVRTGFRERASSGQSSSPAKGNMSPEFAAQQIWQQIVSKEAVRVFDWKYRVGTFISRYLLPKRWVAGILFSSVNERV